MTDLYISDNEKISLDDLVLDEPNRLGTLHLVEEFHFIDQLRAHRLPVYNKIILYGSSGCGKTSAAKAMASALGKQIFILDLANIICSRIGETSQNLKRVFEKACREKAVLLLDEFDQIGKKRSTEDNDSGEMRRLVNSLIQLIDYFPDTSLLIAATNHIDFIDPALLRRFQLKACFKLPSKVDLDDYYDQLLKRFPANLQDINRRYEISFAEAKDHALSQVKKLLIYELRNGLTTEKTNYVKI